MSKVFNNLLVGIVLSFPGSVWANLDSFNSDLNYANSMRGSVKDATAKFDPQQEFKDDYHTNPSQSKYFSGVTQSGDNGLDSDAITQVSQDEAGKTIDDAFKTRPVFHVDLTSPAMQKSVLIQKDSYDISHGISDKYVDCSKAEQCHTSYVTKTCNEQTRTLTKSCTKTATVTVTEEPYQKSETYSGPIAARDNYSANITVPVSGVITSFSINLSSDNVWRCHIPYSGYLQGVYLSSMTGDCGNGLGGLSFSNQNLNIPVTAKVPVVFSIQGGPAYGIWGSGSYSITISVTLYNKVPHVSWTEDCHDTN